MWKFGRYNLIEKISERLQTIVFRGLSFKQQPVVIKVLNETYPSPTKLAGFKWEYQLTHEHDSTHIVKSLELIQDKTGVALIENDEGGISLANILSQRRLSLEECLTLGIEMCKALHDVHYLGIVHKDINPSNIIINERTGNLKIIDFSIAITQFNEIPTIKNPSKIEGTLPYVSPEQTGRMNRLVDYRTDFYSLGVTLYEMVTTKLPFPYEDLLEMIHAHLAKQPIPPSDLDASIPKPVSEIIMKLLSKSADARYQDARGIQADLENCLHQIQSTGHIDPFPLAREDISQSLIIPQMLYGRDDEILTLLNSFDNVSKGNVQFTLITGYSGIGKTSLVQEVYKPMTQHNAFFISGKFDQYLCNIPFSALNAAFKSLIRYLLGFDEKTVASWSQKIVQALGPNLSLIHDIIPDISLIVSAHHLTPSNEIEGAKERKSLVTLALMDFIKVFAQKDHPLIIFLDDLQWVDLATLDFFNKLLRDEDIHYLFLIGAYRKNEVDSTHPLAKAIEALKIDKIPLNHIILHNLDEQSVLSLVSETLHYTSQDTLDLTKLIVDKTGGNPFFIIQFLKTLYQDNLLVFDMKSRSWNWDINKIKQMGITDNVLELMVERLSKFNIEVQNVISIAACIGNTFDIRTLATLCLSSPEDIYGILTPVIQAGYIFTLSEHLLASHNMLEAPVIAYDFKFRHDKVQQAAYALADADSRITYHFAIGFNLFDKLSPEEKEDRLFEIVDHLNLAKDLILSDEYDYWIDLNYQAAVKAKRASAYATALKYLNNCTSHLPPDSWEKNYDKTFLYYKEQIELEFLNSNLEKSMGYFEEALMHAKTNADKSQLHVIPITHLIFVSRYLDAIELARKALALLHIELPTRSTVLEAIAKEEALINKRIKGKDYSIFLDLPPMTDQNMIIAISLLNKITSACLFASETNLKIFVHLKMVSLSLLYGSSAHLPRAMANYCWVLNKVHMNRYQEGYEICNLALKQCDKMQDAFQKCGVLTAQASYGITWVKHLKETFDLIDEGYVLGISTGNFEFACYGIVQKALYLFCNGYMPLESVFLEAKKVRHITSKYRLSIMIAITTGLMLVINSLKGNAKDRLKFSIDAEINEKKLFPDSSEETLSYAMLWYNVLKSQLFYIYGDIQKALTCSDLAEKMGDPFTPFICTAIQAFFRCLILIRLLPNVNEETQLKYKKEIDGILQKLTIWTENNPDGFQTLYQLVCAEKARYEEKYYEAINLYYDAIRTAMDQQFTHYAALANELLGNFWLEQNKQDIAAPFIQKASSLYEIWGATAKVQLMHSEQYPSLLSHAIQEREKMFSVTPLTYLSPGALNIDLSTLLKSSQSIATEINLPKLIQKLLMISSQNIGAQRGVLLLRDNGSLYIHGEYNAVTDEFKSIHDNPTAVDEATDLPLALIRYVNKSHETVVLVNASEGNPYSKDPYIVAKKPKSILCSPILRYNDLVGILYFENNLINGAFTPERLEILHILSTPVAVSVENAKLYTSFESFVPHEFLSQLEKKSIFDVKPGDQVQKDMTILFSDIRNFTALSEKLTPKETYRILNQYLALVNPIIKEHGGFIDKFLGDGIMALFPERCDDALDAAIAMQKAMREANKNATSFEKHLLNIGIGIHYGQLILGTVGNKDRMEGTVISDAVNVTSRIEGLTRFYDTPILVTDNFLNHLKNSQRFHNRFLGKVRVKGRLSQIMIYEILDGYSRALLGKKLQVVDDFAEALDLYYKKKFVDAKDIFVKILEDFPEDHPSEVYLNRIENHLSRGVAENWDGVDDMLEK